MDKITKLFIADFGDEIYENVINAANFHGNGINNKNIGHPLKHALLICIGYQCMELPEYRKFHGLNSVPWRIIKSWIKKNAELKTYQGDFDYLAAIAGVYNEYIK